MKPFFARILAVLIVAGLFVPAIGQVPSNIPLSSRATPKGEPVAETGLLMEGIAHANFKGIEKRLKKKPDDADAWTFTRGQALLIAETGNLLLLRPPKNQGAESWNKFAVELRESATRLARATAAQDLNTSRSRLIEVANACNKCHTVFQVKTRLTPFKEESP